MPLDHGYSMTAGAPEVELKMKTGSIEKDDDDSIVLVDSIAHCKMGSKQHLASMTDQNKGPHPVKNCFLYKKRMSRDRSPLPTTTPVVPSHRPITYC